MWDRDLGFTIVSLSFNFFRVRSGRVVGFQG